MRHDRVRSPALRDEVEAGRMPSTPSRSASSRARRTASSIERFSTMSRLARVCVSSSRISTSPAWTRSPSRTRSSPTTPPVGCCTFLTSDFDHELTRGDHRARELGQGSPSRRSRRPARTRERQAERADAAAPERVQRARGSPVRWLPVRGERRQEHAWCRRVTVSARTTLREAIRHAPEGGIVARR